VGYIALADVCMPFADLAMSRQKELCQLCELAAAAYLKGAAPEGCIPSGWEAIDRFAWEGICSEWVDLVDACFDNGYAVGTEIWLVAPVTFHQKSA